MDWNPVDWASTAARLAGHAWDDIEGFFADRNEAAQDAGASDTDVSNIWGVQPADQLQQSLNTDAGIKAAADPDVTKPIATAEIPPVTPLEGLSAARIAGHASAPVPTPQVPEADADTETSPIDFNEPSARSAYADAMQSGAAQSPQDFAERYAGAYLGSAYSNGVPPPDSAYAAATRGAATLAASLPNARDLTDTAIGVARATNQDATAENVSTVKTNLLNEWADKGTPLMEMYKRTQTDPAFADQMTTPPPAPPPDPYDTALASGDPEAAALVEASKAMEPAVTAHFVGIYNDWDKWAQQEQARQAAAGADVGKLAQGGQDEAFNVAMSFGPSPVIKAGSAVIDAALARLGWNATSFKPEDVFGEAIGHLSPAALDKVAADTSPAHVEAARIAQLHPEDREGALAKLEQPAGEEGTEPTGPSRADVEALVPGYDAAGGYYKMAHGLIGDLLSDESGALSLYHGTGVNFAGERGAPFGRFQLEKVGAGEGAQAYSWGLYFAEDKRISDWYKQMDVRRKGVAPDDGSLYTVHVDVDPQTQMLDWDKPLKAQDQGIQDKVRAALKLEEPPPVPQGRTRLFRGENPSNTKGGGWFTTDPEKAKLYGDVRYVDVNKADLAHFAQGHGGADEFVTDQAERLQSRMKPMDRLDLSMTGEAAFKRIMKLNGATAAQTAAMTGEGNRLASEALKLQGIKGMQYVGSSSGAYNHVIYDPALIKITHRNGVAVPKTMLFSDLYQLMQEGKQRVGSTLEAIHSGLPSWRTPQQIIDRQLSEARRADAQQSIIRGIGADHRTMEQFGAQLDKYRGLVSKHVPEHVAAIGRGDTASALNDPIGNLIGYVENRNWGGTLLRSNMQPLADAIRDVNMTMQQRMETAHQNGLVSLDQYRENYFRHLWQNPRGPEWENLWTEFSGRQGSGQSLQQRTLPTYYDGLMRGLKPRIADPIDLTMFDLGQKTRYLTALNIIGEAKEAGHAYYALKPQNPSDRALQGIHSDIPVGPGLRQVLWGRDGFHQVYNNWLSMGLASFPQTASGYQKAIWLGNMSTGLKLALPTFHFRVVGLASAASGIGQALEELGRGQVGMAGLHAAEGLTVVPRVITDYVKGRGAIKTFRSSGDDPIIQYLTEAGLRVGGRQSVYRMGSESLLETARRGMAVNQTHMENLAGAGREIVRAIGADLHSIAGNAETEGLAKRMTMFLPRTAMLPLTEMGRLMQTATSPLFDHFIPALKVGAGYRRFQSWLQANPGVGDAEKWTQARQIVKDIDNRYGELNQDTIFLHRVAKNIANATLISTGWNYGSYRGFLGALGIDIERTNGTILKWNHTFATSTVGTVAGYAMFNMAEQYLRTGKAPWDTDTPLHDLIDYRTGYMTKYGKPERGGVPSELKEVFDLSKIVATTAAGYASGGVAGLGRGFGALDQYMMGKINPFYQFLHAVVTGQDAIGNHIFASPAAFSKFMKGAFGPIFLEQIAQIKKGSGFGVWSALLGDRGAPPQAEDWPGFIARMTKVFDREKTQQTARMQRENAQLATPDPAIAAPATRGSSGQLSRRQRAERAAAGILTAKQVAAGQSAYAVRAEGEQYLERTAGAQLQQFHDATAQTLNRSRATTTRSRLAYSNNGAWLHAARGIQTDPETGESILRGQGVNARQDVARRYVNQLVQARRQRSDFRRRARLVYGRYATGNESAINPAGTYQGV